MPGIDSTFGLHPEAFNDLEEIREFLAQESPDSADKVILEIFRSIRTTLVPFPNAGHRRPDLTSRPLRFMVVMNQYVIAYAFEETPLWVVSVMHGRRNPRVMAAILRDRA